MGDRNIHFDVMRCSHSGNCSAIENRAFLSSSFRRCALPEKLSDIQTAVMAGLAERIVMGKLAHRFALTAYVPDILDSKETRKLDPPYSHCFEATRLLSIALRPKKNTAFRGGLVAAGAGEGRPKAVPPGRSFLEPQNSSDLKVTPIVYHTEDFMTRRHATARQHSSAGEHVRVWVGIEIGVVKDVEELAAELQAHPFVGQLETLHY
jgi:hypothetical protein